MGFFRKKKVSEYDNLVVRVRDYIQTLPEGTKTTMQQILTEAFSAEIKDMDATAIGALTTDVMMVMEQVRVYLDYGDKPVFVDDNGDSMPQLDEFILTKW